MAFNHVKFLRSLAASNEDNTGAAFKLCADRIEELEAALESAAKNLDLTADFVRDLRGWGDVADGIENDARQARAALNTESEG